MYVALIYCNLDKREHCFFLKTGHLFHSPQSHGVKFYCLKLILLDIS